MTIDKFVDEMKLVEFQLEEISTAALYDFVLEPAGFGLEVLNLHRNAGDTVDSISRIPLRLAGEDTIIRLLYRP